jgi:cytochrome c-type biogenesis protein CcmH/NrfG
MFGAEFTAACEKRRPASMGAVICLTGPGHRPDERRMMDAEVQAKPAARRAKELQRERVEALLEEQRRREERIGIRRLRFRGPPSRPGARDESQWSPVDP